MPAPPIADRPTHICPTLVWAIWGSGWMTEESITDVVRKFEKRAPPEVPRLIKKQVEELYRQLPVYCVDTSDEEPGGPQQDPVLTHARSRAQAGNWVTVSRMRQGIGTASDGQKGHAPESGAVIWCTVGGRLRGRQSLPACTGMRIRPHTGAVLEGPASWFPVSGSLRTAHPPTVPFTMPSR